MEPETAKGGGERLPWVRVGLGGALLLAVAASLLMPTFSRDRQALLRARARAQATELARVARARFPAGDVPPCHDIACAQPLGMDAEWAPIPGFRFAIVHAPGGPRLEVREQGGADAPPWSLTLPLGGATLDTGPLPEGGGHDPSPLPEGGGHDPSPLPEGGGHDPSPLPEGGGTPPAIPPGQERHP